MELTPALVTTIEQTIATRLNIYADGPYRVEYERTQYAPYVPLIFRIRGRRFAGEFGVTRMMIEDATEAAFAGILDRECHRIERALQTWLRANPPPPEPRGFSWGSMQIRVDGQAFPEIGSINYANLLTPPPQTIEITTGYAEPEPERISSWQRLAAGGIV